MSQDEATEACEHKTQNIDTKLAFCRISALYGFQSHVGILRPSQYFRGFLHQNQKLLIVLLRGNLKKIKESI